MQYSIIVVIGYGFGDAHINKILSQALSDADNRKLLVVSNVQAESDQELRRNDIEQKLGLTSNSGRVVILADAAKAFLTCENIAERITEHLPADEGSPF